jgi:hypothetical protein
MEEKMIPYIAFESATSRQERTIRRVWILCIILIIALIGTNAGWIYYESQWQVVETTTVTQDLDASDGGDAVINDGVHINGESEANSN